MWSLNSGEKQTFGKLNLVLYALFVVIIMGYVLNASNVNMASENWKSHTGLDSNLVYFKIVINGLVHMVTLILFYQKISSRNFDVNRILFLLKLIVSFAIVISIFDVVSWLVNGSQLGRYNYDQVITNSPGISFFFSLIGFICLKLLNDFYFNGSMKQHKLLVGCSFVVLVFSMIINQVRLLQVTFVFILLIYYIIHGSYRNKLIILSLFVLSVFFLGRFEGSEYLNFNSYSEIQMNSDNVDFLIRLSAIEDAFSWFKENWIFGIGYGMYPVISKNEFDLFGIATKLSSIHNGFVSYSCELGVLGSCLYFVLYHTIINDLWRAYRSLTIVKKGKYLTLTLLLFVLLFFEGFVSNDLLLPPPSEYSYFPISILLITLYVAGKKLGKQLELIKV
jgi:hypothetical protein